MKSFKLKFDTKKASKQLKKKIDKVIESDRWKDEAARLAIKNIQGQTRLQKNISTGESQKKISKKWEKRKKQLAKNNPKGASFGPSKSNLTVTGQLLESLKRIDDKKTVIIEPTESRTPYKNKDGSFQKNPPTNKKLAEYLAEKDFIFIGHNEKLRKILKKKVKEEFFRKFREL